MKRKNWTREEWRAWRQRSDEVMADVHTHIERIKAELAAKQKPT
jgi:hypothetical protein